jgi:phenylalanyl-tRNA synthetase beta subunit
MSPSSSGVKRVSHVRNQHGTDNKQRLTFNGQHDLISQMIGFFITTSVITKNLTKFRYVFTKKNTVLSLNEKTTR